MELREFISATLKDIVGAFAMLNVILRRVLLKQW